MVEEDCAGNQVDGSEAIVVDEDRLHGFGCLCTWGPTWLGLYRGQIVDYQLPSGWLRLISIVGSEV